MSDGHGGPADDPRDRDPEGEGAVGLDLDGPERLWPSASEADEDTRGEPAEDDDVPVRRVRRTTQGRRAKLRRRRRRRSFTATIGYVLLTLGVAAGLVFAYEAFQQDDDAADEAGEPIAAQPEQDVQPTLVFATFDEADRTAGASLVLVAGHDRLRDTTTLLFVPTTTMADVPGHGLLPVGDAFAFGQGPLLDATLDNLLGVDFDHVVSVSEQGWVA